MRRTSWGAVALILIPFASVFALDEKADPARVFRISEKTDILLDRYCYDCHDGETQKGDIRLNNLPELENSKRLDLLNRMQEQLYFQHMPPRKKKQPSESDRAAMLGAISGNLKLHEASTLEGKLQKPEFGNYVDHDKLFSGDYKDLPGYTYDRRWLISEYIFNAKFQRMLQNRTMASRHKKRLEAMGGSKIRDLSLSNPFLMSDVSGVRYYANEDLTGGHVSSMLTNAQKTSQYITGYLAKRNSKYLPAINGSSSAVHDGFRVVDYFWAGGHGWVSNESFLKIHEAGKEAGPGCGRAR